MSRIHGHRHRSTAVATVCAVMVSVLTFSSAVAGANWSTSGSGSGGGGTYVMPTGSQPSGRASSTRVVISWAPVTLPGGQAVGGYLVYRTDAGTGTQYPAGPGCSGVVTTNGCVESSVPAGSWIYSDVPVVASWSGPASPGSTPITVP